MRIELAPHPVACVRAFTTAFAAPLADQSSETLLPLLMAEAPAPLTRDDAIRRAVRDMLRHGGYKPTGRGKPASEYLLRAAEAGMLTSINTAVDACNAVSLHSGLPVSVVDLACAREPFRIAIADTGERYVFNAAAQEIDVGGLLCLHDAQGPCANPVRDAQRTKTSGATRNTLSILWGTNGYKDRLDRATAWYRELLEAAGGTTEAIVVE